jgi:selenocysteine lyase/cysteine desulfurase
MSSSERSIYLDHAATTAVDPRVVEAMLPYFTVAYGNPSSVYRLADPARAGMQWARETVAEILGARLTRSSLPAVHRERQSGPARVAWAAAARGAI